jgi:PAS domain S-box-containing protein
MFENTKKYLEDETIKEFEHCRLLFENIETAFALHEIILNQAGVAVDYRFLYVNNQFEKQTGLNAENILGKTVLEVLPGMDAFWIERYGNVALTGETVNFEGFCEVLKRHYKVTAFSPKVNKFATLFTDISDNIIAGKQLTQAIQNFNSIYNVVPEAVFIHDLNTYNILDVNEAGLELYGYSSKEEMLIKSIGDLSSKTEEFNQEKAEIIIEKAKKGDVQLVEWQARRKNDSVFWIEMIIKKAVINSIEKILVLGRDISSKKENEQKLAESERRYTSFFKNHKLPIMIIDPDTFKIVEVNPAACVYYGFEYNEFCQKEIFDINVDNINKTKVKVSDAKGEKNNTFETKHRLASGEIKDVEVFSYPVVFDEKTYLYSIVHDITDNKRALLDIERVNRYFQAIIEKATDGITLIDVNGYFKYASPNAKKMFGYDDNDLFNYHPNDLTHPDDLPEVLKHLSILLSDKSYQPTLSYRFRHKSGKWIWIESTFTNMSDDPFVELIVINFKDITDRIVSENKLKESKEVLNKLFTESSRLINSDVSGVDYQHFTDVYLDVSGAQLALFNEYDKDGTSITRSFSEFVDFKKQSSESFSFNFVGFKWQKDPEKEEILKNCIITKFECLADLAKYSLPECVLRNMEDIFDFGCIYVINIINEGQKFAEIVLAFEKNKSIENTSVLEIFSNQIGEYMNRKKTEESLRISEEKYRIMFENSPQPMWIIDANDYSFIEVNQSAINLYGYSKDEFLQMKIKDIVINDDIHLLNGLITQKTTTFKSVKPIGNIKKTKETIYVDINSFKFLYKGQDARHIMVNDVTERMQAEELSNRKMDELLRFHKLTVNRELSMIELKKEVNQLLKQVNQPEKYRIVGG